MKFTDILWLLSLAFLCSCSPSEDGPPALEVKYMDTTVLPGKDFYRFVNGKWLDNTSIPSDRGRWSMFSELRKKNDSIIRQLFTTAATSSKFKPGSDERKAIDFFSIGMDSTKAEVTGISPLLEWFRKIDGISDNNDLLEVLAQLHQAGYHPFFHADVGPNQKNSQINSLYINAGGLGLPNRDYYTKNDEKSILIREKYIEQIVKTFQLTQVNGDITQLALGVFDIEKEIALATLPPAEARNTAVLYNTLTIQQIQDTAPAIPWRSYLQYIGTSPTNIDSIVVYQPKQLTAISNIFKGASPINLKAYLKWHIIQIASDFLNHEMVKAHFAFFGGVIQGSQTMLPRWQRVMQATDDILGEAVGKMYVAAVFPPEAKTNAKSLVDNVVRAFKQRIRNLDWLSEQSKDHAYKKLDHLSVKIGYPDNWRDFQGMTIETKGSYLKNIENARRWLHYEDMKLIGQPVDKTRWGMSPQTINAYFNATNNEIVFPAAILQPPFYNYKADPAVNYGGIGAVIGHEISHGFDDEGSLFDWEGNLVEWWTTEDRSRFEARAQKLVEQYNNYEALDSLFVQGDLTLGENIGDLGGVNAAFDALQMHLNEIGQQKEIDGLTQEQRFFISWATIWRAKYRDETLRNQVLSGYHSPPQFRAIGPLENMDAFYDAFSIREGDQLWKPPSDRIKIW